MYISGLKIHRGYLIFFQCKFKFYFTKWTPKAVFSWVAMKIQVLVFMSEIKFDLTLKKKSNFLFLLWVYLQLLIFYLLFYSHVRKQNLFLPFCVNLVLFSMFRGYNIGWKHSFAPRKWAQIAFKAIKCKKWAQKKCRSQWQSVWCYMQKKHYVSTIKWRQQ